MEALGRPAQRNRLVLSIIEEHFGSLVKDVAQLLLTRQRCTLADLKGQLCKTPSTAPTGQLVACTRVKMLPSEVRRSLLVLSQHNCLVTYLPTEEEMLAVRKVELCYRIDTAIVLNRMRYPKYLSVIKQHFGDLGVALAEELMHHGRQTAPGLISAAALKAAKDEAQAEGVEDGPYPDRIEALEKDAGAVLERLIHGRYFVSVAPIDVDSLKASREKVAAEIAATMRPGKAKAKVPGAAGQLANGTTARQKRKNESKIDAAAPKAKRKPPAAPTQDELPIELRMMMKNEQDLATLARQHGVQFAADLPAAGAGAAAPVSAASERPSRTETAERGRGRGRGRGRRTAPGTRTPSETDTIPTEMREEPNGQEVSAVAVGVPSLGPRDNVLWKIGDEQFIRECRRQKCVNFAGEKMSRPAAEVVAAMLTLSAPTETSASPELSQPVTLKQICEKSKIEAGTARRLLDLMKTDALHMVMKSSDDAEWSEKATFVVNMGNIIESLKARAIHSIAEARYGIFAARICELLARKKYLDQQKVGEMAILPAKTAREQLYLLQREGWITNIDISKRSDFNVSSTYWFWTLDHANLQRIILEHLYHTAYNLRARRQHEFLQGKDLVEFAQAGEQETERLQRLSTMLARLDKALLEVDETIMLFARY